MAVGSSPPDSSAVSLAAPASGMDSPTDSPAGLGCRPNVRRPTGWIRHRAKNAARTPVRLVRQNGPVRRRKVRPGAWPGLAGPGAELDSPKTI
jgi:hypothetical protein